MKIILETERLILREQTIDDLDFLAETFGDDETMRFYPQHYGRDDAEAWLRRNLECYRRDGCGLWLAVAKESSEPIGQIGLVRTVIEGMPLYEIGYVVNRRFWKRGYAAEGALGVRDHVFQVRNEPFVVAFVRPINVPSQGVARKLGMQPVHRLLKAGLEHDVWYVANDRRAETASANGG